MNILAVDDTVETPVRAAAAASGLTLLAENPRFFQYKGKPLLSVTYVAEGGMPSRPEMWSRERLEEAARYGNHIYLAAHPTWVLADFPALHAKLRDETHWAGVREVARWCHEHDVLLTLIFFSHKWSYAANAYLEPGCTDMVLNFDDPRLTEDLGRHGVPGLTRLDLQRLAIRHAVRATWEFPNVIYFHTWEIDHAVIRQGKDADGAMHRWWVDEFRAEGARQFPGRRFDHLFSIEYGAEPASKLRSMLPPGADILHPAHPAIRGADFIYAECADGFASMPRQITNSVHALNVPLVRMSYSCGPRSGQVGPSSPDDIRERLIYGVHPSGHFHHPILQAVKEYFLQARWYVENIRTWQDEVFSEEGSAGDELIDARLPRHRPSRRPSLANPAGFENGCKREGDAIVFGCVYRHADDLPPAQAEVWVDCNGDGRFATDPAAGERIAMQAGGMDFENGVRYEARIDGAVGHSLRYVFRFADLHWYPPMPGGLMLAPYSDFLLRVE